MHFVPLPERVGETQELAGYFTKAIFLRGRRPLEVENRVGYRTGRLDRGFWLLFLCQMPTPAQFEFRGYSQMSDGVIQGHLDPEDKRNAEQRLTSEGYDVVKLKQKTIESTFELTGPKRLAKIRPVAGAAHDPGKPDYPPGLGIPQWTLTAPLKWRVAAFVGPGEAYLGDYA